MSKSKSFRPENWRKYTQSKRDQGNIFIYFAPGFERGWYAENKGCKRGERQTYSDLSIELILRIRYIFKMPLRQAQGFIIGLFEKVGISLDIPDYTTLSRRAKGLSINYRISDLTDNLHIAVDASGVGIYVGNEWYPEKYNHNGQRKWGKLSIAINAITGEVLANTLATSDDADCSQVKPLLSQLPDMLGGFYGDGSYDKHEVYQAIKDHQEFPVNVVIPPIETLVVPDDPCIALSQRHQHKGYLDKFGKDRWRNKHHYGRREKSEGFFARFKSAFGEKLVSKNPTIRQTETDIKCKIVNMFNNMYTDGFTCRKA